MYGYIYMVEILPTDEIYIGKKKSDKFVKSYYGSGKLIKSRLKEFGKRIVD